MKDSSIGAGLDLNGCHVLSCSPESNRLPIIARDRRPCGHKPDAGLKFFPIGQVHPLRLVPSVPSLPGVGRGGGGVKLMNDPDWRSHDPDS
jgi:hypothetical protein